MQSGAWHVVRMKDEQRGVVVDRIGALRNPRVGDAMVGQVIAGRGGLGFLEIAGERVLAVRAGEEGHRDIVPGCAVPESGSIPLRGHEPNGVAVAVSGGS